MITADLLVGLALATLVLGLDCITFFKEDPCVKLKMCYGAGVVLGAGSAWLGELGSRQTLCPTGSWGECWEPAAPPQRGLGSMGGCVVLFNKPPSS